ncbi:MAG: ThiF family adenylyltransferase [Microbacterium sp.]|uniref:ThiF family adenylyltransferase n=1 Tax=Microbacterium sp. TaxID=51671 RepID=UPI001AC90202|nr:ThiF family adenylyltransferase [Microbacterium sp.]MBN9177532.1 ThiF family adenylyltransferase [Microbacterium sp.]
MNPLVEPGPALGPEHIARYGRQLALPGFGELAQRRLRAARVLVIGAGGLGSAVAPALVGAGVGAIGIIDDDAVELSNLHRQLSHGVADIGRPKVDSLRDTLRAIDPDIVVEVHRVRATSATLPGILASYDLLIDGSDNFATRYLAADAAQLAGVPLVWGSILRFQGQVGVSGPGHGPGYRDLFAAPPDELAEGEVLSCEIGGVLPSLCTAVGSFLATEAIKLITGIGEPLIGRVLFYDALTARTREIAYAADETRAPVTTLTDAEARRDTDGSDRDDAAVSAAELLRRIRAGEPVRLLDVRGPDEAELQRIPGGELLPLPALEAGASPAPGAALIVYCAQGPRSQRAARVLKGRGFEAAYLAGGIRAYADLGGTVETGAFEVAAVEGARP